MSRRRLSRAIAEHVQSSQLVYRECGNLTPKVWVHGTQSLIAEPVCADGLTVTEYDLAGLLCAMANEHGGSIIGRSAEVWVRVGDNLPELSGRLADHVDTDPSISTGLLVAGFDRKHDQLGAVVTRPALMDDGSTEWRLAPLPAAYVERLTGLLVLADTMSCDWSSEARADEIGWHLAWV